MSRNAVLRLLLLALFVIAFYFVLIRDRRNESKSGGPRTRSGRNEPSATYPSPSSPHERKAKKHLDQSPEGESAAAVTCSSAYFSQWQEPANASCSVRLRNGLPVPDPQCTPGGINPSVSVDVLRDPSWRTRAVRNCESSESQKHIAYRWYDIQKPRMNSNQNQVCELDHLVPLELGGADGLGNIWPQCGPDAVSLNERYFKQKDRVENYLAEEVKAGRVPLDSAQRGIASDWPQYLDTATRWCQGSGRCR